MMQPQAGQHARRNVDQPYLVAVESASEPAQLPTTGPSGAKVAIFMAVKKLT